MVQVVFTEAKQPQSQDDRFREDVREHLHGEYLLDDGSIVYGNSTSYVKQWLRDSNTSNRRWRNLGNDSRFEDLCELKGFKVRRGRGRRIYHGGKMGWGVPCDVITELHPVPMFNVFDKDGKQLNKEPLTKGDAAGEVCEYRTEEFDAQVEHQGFYKVNNRDFTKPPVAQVARPVK